MPADASLIAYFAPVWAFLAVFVIMFALLAKTELLGESKWLNLFVSFVIASIFISAASVQQYVLTIVPWMAVLVISLFFILVLIGFIGKGEWMHEKIGIVVVITAVVIFIVSGVKVFYTVISPYFPGSADYGFGASANGLVFSDWFFSGPVLGAIFLLALSGIISWVLVKAK
ncbi:hypothetical protein AUJ84_00970 [Candidatus Pacearchaeota archaeon CG1_02_32_132]|nr:MAG: hypothetical protein AUJ84_00970 [Candidatus Pacearchaeota archaeon CG1_02_32_132]